MRNYSDEEMEVAIYGLKRLGMFLISMVVVAIIGLLMGNVQGVFLFLLFFIPLRIFAGGLHLPTLWMCAITSSALIVAVVYILNNIEIVERYVDQCNAMLLVGIIVIIVMAPVDTANKLLFKEEKIKYKIISIIITIVEMAIFYINQGNEFIKALVLVVIVIEAFGLAVQKILNCANERRDKSERK